MPKVLVEFNSIEEAQAAIYATSGTQSPAPAPHFAPNVAPPSHPAPVYQPQPPTGPAPYVPPQGAPYTPPAQPGAYAPAPGAPAPAPQAPNPAGSPAISQAQVAGAAQAYAKTHGPKAAQAKLKELGVTSVGQINPAHYEHALAALRV